MQTLPGPQRLVLSVFAIFWVTMNVLLWRAEMAGNNPTGSPVSVDVVLQKILTAPDSSTLEVLSHDRRIGYCHWLPDPGEEHSAQTIFASDYVPEGMLRARTGYALRFDGYLQLDAPDIRPRFEAILLLATNRTWQELELRVSLKPSTFTIRASAARQELQWTHQDGSNPPVTNVIRLADLQNPQAVFSTLGGPWAGLLAAALPTDAPPRWQLGLQWQAHHDRLRIANSPMRVYRLETRILDRYDIRLIVNRVGEILRIELPNGLRLVNEELWSL